MLGELRVTSAVVGLVATATAVVGDLEAGDGSGKLLRAERVVLAHIRPHSQVAAWFPSSLNYGMRTLLMASSEL